MRQNENRLKAAQAKLREMRAAGEQVKHLNPIEKAQGNPNSLRCAINAKCFDCQGRDYDPCVEWRIGNCEISDCPLFPVRPHQHLEGTPPPRHLDSFNGQEARI